MSFRDAGDEVLFINANGHDEHPTWLKLVKPRSGSLNEAKQAERGNDFLFEMGVEVEDLDGFMAKAKSLGVAMNRGSSGSADKDAFFATTDACGLPLRIFQRGTADSSITAHRDAV